MVGELAFLTILPRASVHPNPAIIIVDDDEVANESRGLVKDIGTIQVELQAIKDIIMSTKPLNSTFHLPGESPISEKTKKAGGHSTRCELRRILK